MKTFTITEDHLKLARKMYVGWQDCEFGAPEINPKRPYGNSSVYRDIGEILGIAPADIAEEDYSEEQKRFMRVLHEQMEYVLQIALSTGRFEAGNYEGAEYSNRWRKL